MEPRIGQYRIEAEVARGGMGVVFRARSPDGTPVALKLLHAGRAASEAQRRRFTREAGALARIEHPGVVRLLEVGEHQGAPFLALEWIEGESLEARIARQGPLAPREAAWLVARVARALARCHALGVLHRDLKPDNVLLRASDGEPLLVDFGLTRDLLGEHSLTRTGQLIGTPGWWAPEQARGDPSALGPHTDVYGLGALLHGALTGRSPWEPGSLADALAGAEKDPLPPSRLRPEIPRALDEVCLRCLARDPRSRWLDAGIVADQLERWREGASRQPGPRRGRARPLALVGGLALALGVAGVASLMALRASSPAPPAVPPAPPPPPSALDPLAAAAAATSAGRFDEARAALAPIASGSDPLRAAEALWALHHLAATEDPEQPLAAGPPLHALLSGPTAPPWTDRALVIALLAQGRSADALDSARDLVVLYPDDAWSQFLLSVATTRSGGSPDEAYELARRACELAPDWITPRLAVVFLDQERRRFAEALAEIDRALALPNLPARARGRFLVHRCDLLNMTGDPAGALATAAELRALVPDQREGWIVTAMAHIVLEQLDPAEAALDRADALGPPTALDLIFRAEIRMRRGDLPAVVELQGRALALDPSLDEVRLERTRLLAILGRTDEGLRELAARFGSTPGVPIVLLHRARLREQAGLTDDAGFDLALALSRLGPGNPDADELRARLLIASGDPSGPGELERVIAAHPREARPLVTRARLRANAGQAELAANDARAAVAIEPCLREAHLLLARLAFEGKRIEEMVGALRAADALAPLGVEDRVNLGGMLLELGRAEEALAELRRARKERPDGPLVLLGLARAALAAGDAAGAEESAARALQVVERDELRCVALHVRSRALALRGEVARALADARELEGRLDGIPATTPEARADARAWVEELETREAAGLERSPR